MTEVDVILNAGPVRAIPLSPALSGAVILTGPARLMGWSVRESGFEVPAEAAGSQAAPAAGTVIATIAPAGGAQYAIAWTVTLEGAVAAADRDNFGLYRGATLLTASANPAVAGEYVQDTVIDNDVFASAYSVKAIGAATAGTTYDAQITIQPVAGAEAVLELQDGNQPLAEISVPYLGTSTAWFGPGGVHVRGIVRTSVVSGALTGAIYAVY